MIWSAPELPFTVSVVPLTLAVDVADAAGASVSAASRATPAPRDLSLMAVPPLRFRAIRSYPRRSCADLQRE
jgi:hypothetical protein